MAKLQIFLPGAVQISHDLTQTKTTIGRAADNSLSIADPSVSSRHAEIFLKEEIFHLHDLESTNGTFLNGEQVTNSLLQNGDKIRFGLVESVFYGDNHIPHQVLPESAVVARVFSTLSVRPPEFVSSSPIPKMTQGKDPVALALYATAGLGILVFFAAVVILLGMAAPV